jgi:peptidase M23-like protein
MEKNTVVSSFNRGAVLIPLAVYAFLPLLALLLSWKEGPEIRFSIPILAGTWLFLFIVVRSDVFGYWLRFVFLGMMLLAVGRQFRWIGALIAAAIVLGLWTFLRRFPRAQALNLQFPFQQGLFYVGHGGNYFIINHHFKNASQRYAVDILRINRAGFPSRGILPGKLDAYEVFGEPVYSPCDGVVTAAVDGVEDLPPPQRTLQEIAGNHLVIQCDKGNFYVGLAHLQKGSLRVRKGDRVHTSQILGKAGNSGHTMEPHLHIHAKKGGRPDIMLDGIGVPITFSGRWLVRNSLWFGRKSSFSQTNAS